MGHLPWTEVGQYLASPTVSRWRKLAGVAAVLYVLLPADAVPDVIPMLGWLDDLGVLAATAWWLLRDVRRHARTRSPIARPSAASSGAPRSSPSPGC